MTLPKETLNISACAGVMPGKNGTSMMGVDIFSDAVLKISTIRGTPENLYQIVFRNVLKPEGYRNK